MNEDGNNGITSGPVFSSPNISSNNDGPMRADIGSEPTPQAITSSDIAAMSNTNTGMVAAAAASMPENDAPAAVISSTPDSGAGAQKSRSRMGFGGRRFNAQQQQQQSAPVFAGAPDFFNQAAGDIVIDPYGGNGRKSKKPLIIIAVVAVLVIAGGITAAMLLSGGSKPKSELSGLSNNEIGGKLELRAADLKHIEITYNNIAKKDIDVYDLLEEDFCSNIKAGKEAFDELKPLVINFSKAMEESQPYYDYYQRAASALEKETDFSGMYERCTDAVSYISGESDSTKSEYGEAFQNAAKEIKESYDLKIPEGLVCPEEAPVITPECENYWTARSKKKHLDAQAPEKISKDIFGITSTINEDDRSGYILAELVEKLNIIERNEKK